MARKYASMLGSEPYAGQDSRRQMEGEDYGMISEDKSAMANLPQQVMMKYYAKPPYASYQLDDTIKGIDQQISDDMRGGKRRTGRDGQQ